MFYQTQAKNEYGTGQPIHPGSLGTAIPRFVETADHGLRGKITQEGRNMGGLTSYQPKRSGARPSDNSTANQTQVRGSSYGGVP